jgi:hypothetical protein
MTRFVSCTLLTALITTTVIPGQVTTSPDGLIELHTGNVPILLAVPHDGGIVPSGWPARTSASCSGATGDTFETARDGNTWPMTQAIMARFTAVTGKHLWVVRNTVDRRYLDANRERLCAAGDNFAAQLAFESYHQFLSEARATFSGRAFFIDVHGHSHVDGRIELGFGIPRANLYDPESSAGVSTLKTFAALQGGPFTPLLRDLGTRLTNAGFPALPSTQDWTVESGESFFEGGYTIQRYGCPTVGDLMCGVQMETNKSVRGSSAARAAFAAAFVDALIPYLAQFGVTW